MKATAGKKFQGNKPHCRKCGGADLEFAYTEDYYERKIDETTVLAQACYYLGEAVSAVAMDDGRVDAVTLGAMSQVLADLASMLRLREDNKSDGKEAAPEAQS